MATIYDRDLYEERSRIIKAISHPTRLFIAEQIRDRELCVNEIQEMIGDDISTISKHLRILKNSNLVDIDRRGTCIYYRLKVPCILDIMTCVEDVLSERKAGGKPVEIVIKK